jgi:putative oxidoreductase
MDGEDLGKLVLRLTVGVLMLFHGMHKVLDGIGDIRQMVAAHGLPEMLAYGVYLGEVVGPILVILGLFSRIGGLLIAVNMIVAVLLAGMGSLLAVDPHFGGYALELEAFYLFCGVAVMLLGAGRIGIGGGRWN